MKFQSSADLICANVCQFCVKAVEARTNVKDLIYEKHMLGFREVMYAIVVHLDYILSLLSSPLMVDFYPCYLFSVVAIHGVC